MGDGTVSVRALTAPPFAPLQACLARLPGDRFPDCADLNLLLGASVLNGTGRPVHCVRSSNDHADQAYETRAWRSGEIVTRPDNWHDLFNSLAWCVFPETKREINAQHAARLATPATGAGSSGGSRGAARDVLTLFDEDGIIVPCALPELAELLTTFQWKALFWERREQVRRHMDFCVFGHALYDKLRAPFHGVTAKALLLQVDEVFFSMPAAARLATIDAMAAARLREPATLQSTRGLAPLPVLGIAGWCEQNEAAEYYDDARQFRPGRRNASAEASAGSVWPKA